MTSTQAQLFRTLNACSSKHKSIVKDGFTLTELLMMVMIGGILGVVALPQFMNQTKKAASTEGTQQASEIVKQASVYYLENGKFSSGINHSNHKNYSGSINTNNTNFIYEYDGTKDVLAVIDKGNSGHNKIDRAAIKVAADLKGGTYRNPIFSGVLAKNNCHQFFPT